ncbi:MAG: tetratricopeptide repeat protein, partial [Rhodospirillales bacterium]
QAAVKELLRRKPEFSCSFAKNHLFYIKDPAQKERYLEGLRKAGIPETAGEPTTADTVAPPPLPDVPSIAVLPFANLSGDPEQEYFSDGVADDLITALSNVRSFFVIDRSSSFTFKGKAVTMKEVGQALGVRYVVEGSVRKAGNKVRVSTQLVEAATGTHVWGDRYDGALDDIFDLQDRIVASVVGAIEPQLHRAEVERIRHKRPDSFDAYDLTLAGLAHMNRLTPEDTDKGLALFRRAIEADPTYARAYACASWCYRRRAQLKGMVLSDAERAEAVRLAQAALKADSTDPYVLWQAGITAALVEGDIEEGTALVDRSLAINANSNRAWLSSANQRCRSGDPETAIEHAEKAMRLSPLDRSMWVAYGCLATAHMQLENYETAAEWARKSVRMHRDYLPAHLVRAASLAQLGRESEAKAAVRELLTVDPGLTTASLKKRFPIAGYRNLEGFLDGLRAAGLPA